MGNVDEYRRSAASMLDLAQRTECVADKNRLLVMAEAWLELANRATKQIAIRWRGAPDQSPLVRARRDAEVE
jgi:hypothetical protein